MWNIGGPWAFDHLDPFPLATATQVQTCKLSFKGLSADGLCLLSLSKKEPLPGTRRRFAGSKMPRSAWPFDPGVALIRPGPHPRWH
jgi:hypothetical protein